MISAFLVQETRRILIAVWQHIVYDEYVPTVIGNELAEAYRMKSKGPGEYNQGELHGYLIRKKR